jgi:hypothetical protein
MISLLFFSKCNTKKFIFLMEIASVYSKVGTEFICTYYIKFMFPSANCWNASLIAIILRLFCIALTLLYLCHVMNSCSEVLLCF